MQRSSSGDKVSFRVGYRHLLRHSTSPKTNDLLRKVGNSTNSYALDGLYIMQS